MKILVTGGAGFIGSHLCEALLKRGDQVVCVDNFNNYYDPKRKVKNISDCLKNPDFSFVLIDISNFNQLKEVFEKERPDKVIHLAARAGTRASINDPFLYQETNILGTLNLLELAKKFQIRSFVFGSSSSVYGARKNVPFSEDDRVDFPISPYASTKKAGEEFCYCYHHLHGIKVTCLRFFTVYGPRGRPDMAPFKFTNLIFKGRPIEMYGDGSSQRDYTFVSDIVMGIILALDKELDFEIINIGNSNPIRLRYFISLIEENLGKQAQIIQKPDQPGDVPVTFANVSKAKQLLGYDPKVSIEEGMKKFVEWFKSEVPNAN